MWTLIEAGVATDRDHPGSFEGPLGHFFILKKGRAGAETLLENEMTAMGMPLIESSLPPLAESGPSGVGAEVVPRVMDDAARAAAEQTLSVLLSELTNDPEVKNSL